MPFYNAPDAVAAITVDGDANGYVTVADASQFYPGARAWLRSNTQASKEYEVTDIATGNKIGLREVPAERYGGVKYGRTPVTQFKAAEGATICQSATTVAVELSNLTKLNRA